MTRLARLLAYLALIALLGLMIASLFMRSEDMPAPPPAPIVGQIDRIVVVKATRRMHLIQEDKVVRTYQVALGFSPAGTKIRQGDGKTPEGEFTIDRRNPKSAYHLSLGLDYPRPEDRKRAAQGGYDPGGDIFIHGQPNALPEGLMLRGDWTAGCIAVNDTEMREIWEVTPVGTKVVIQP